MANVIVIGGGAAGMMAAITAVSQGHNVTLFEKNENTINEITSYEYKEESSILLDKFLGGKTFKGDYSKGICEKYKKDNLYLEVKVVTFDNKIDLINIPLVMEGKCKW